MKFADTSWWVAWSLPDDRRHEDAVRVLASLRPTEQVISTNHVVGETWTFLNNRGGHRASVTFLDRVDRLIAGTRLIVHHATPDQERQAWSWLRQHDERAYSFVDATSFRVMKDRRLREVLAFDQDFAAAGFVELRPT